MIAQQNASFNPQSSVRTPAQWGKYDARSGAPFVPNYFDEVGEKKEYANAYMGVRACEKAAKFLGLPFVAPPVDEDVEIVAPNSLGGRDYTAQDQFENWVAWQQ